MNTQSMPALVRAMSGRMPQQAIRQLMQALGNCNQDVNQRGGMNVQPTYRLQNGVANPGTWNPNQYPGLLPSAGSGDFIISLPGIPGYTNSPWNSVFYGGNQFSFPTSQEFVLNNFYGGPSAQIGGAVNLEFASITNLQPQGQDGQGPSIASPSIGSGATTVLNQIINQTGGQIPVPDLEPPTVLDPIQYVTGVSVFLSKSRKGITLPKHFASNLTQDDFETAEVPVAFSIAGETNLSLPPIPDAISANIAIAPTENIAIPTQYSLAGSATAAWPIITGVKASEGDFVNVAVTPSVVSSSSAMPADAAIGGNISASVNLNLGSVNVHIPIGQLQLAMNLPVGFDADTCSLTYGDVLVNIAVGDIASTVELGVKTASLTAPATGLSIESGEAIAVDAINFTATLNPADLTVAYSDSSKLLLPVDFSNLTVEASDNISLPSGYAASVQNATLSGGESQNLTISGGNFSVSVDNTSQVLSGVKPAEQLSTAEMGEEFFVLEDAAITTSVSTEFALTTPFGGQ